MSIDEIKSVSLVEYLSFHGYKPVRKSNGKFWYLSPLHQETTPSFKVNTALNLWYDHALNKGGNIINFASYLYPTLKMHDLLLVLKKQIETNNFEYESYSKRTDFATDENSDTVINNVNINTNTKIISIKEITNRNLVAYIRSRGIPIPIALNYCKEIHYQMLPSGKHYYGICFPNVLSGYEVRNKYSKRCVGRKSYSIIGNSNRKETAFCCIFEGFFDFLSYMARIRNSVCERFMKNRTDYIVLNSVSTIDQIHNILSSYETIFCYFDNDSAGRTAMETMKVLYCDKVVDKSYLYNGYKDLNEHLICQKESWSRCPETEQK